MKKTFAVVGLGIALIFALSLAFYFVIFLPNKEKINQELKRQELELEKQKVELERIKVETPTPKPKTSYDICVKECTNRYSDPKDGVCDSTQRYIYSRTYARFMCQMTEPACRITCGSQ